MSSSVCTRHDFAATPARSRSWVVAFELTQQPFAQGEEVFGGHRFLGRVTADDSDWPNAAARGAVRARTRSGAIAGCSSSNEVFLVLNGCFHGHLSGGDSDHFNGWIDRS